MEISMMIYFRNYLIFQKKYDFEIKTMNVDENHLHMLISMKPSISISQIVRVLKQESIVYIWKKYKQLLKLYFWKEHTFWSDEYFVASIGNANEKTIQKYIQEQGNE